MASPNATFTDLVTTTLRHTPERMADNISNHNALVSRLKQKGNIKTISGGNTIVEPLDFGGNTNYQRYSDYDALSINAHQPLTSAEYNWAQAAIHVTASGAEIRKNMGSKEQMFNLVKARVKSAYRDAANSFSTDVYSSGALTNQVGGLAHLIQTDGSGTVGGIDSSTYTWWKNQFKEMTGTGTYASILQDMNNLWMSCVRGKDEPDLLVSTHDLFAAYENTLQQWQRYSDSRTAEGGFRALKYKGADVIYDSDATNFTTTGEKMYFLNSDYIYLVEHKEAKWSRQEDKVPVNQDAVVIPIIWMGQMVCANRARQGVMIDAS